MKNRQKKILLISTLLFATLLLTSLPAAADSAAVLCTTGTQDENGDYIVAVSLFGTEGINMMQFSVYYDETKLSCISVETGSVFQGNLAPTINASRPGEIAVSWDSLKPILNSGTLLILHVHLIAARGEIGLAKQEDIIFAGEDLVPMAVECTGCVVEMPQKESTPAPAFSPAFSQEPNKQELPSASPIITIPTQETESVKQNMLDTGNGPVTKGESHGLTLSEDQIQLIPGETAKLETVEDTVTIWSSSNEQVATVDESGNVMAHGAGTVLITATSEDGTAYATSAVIISTPTPEEPSPLQQMEKASPTEFPVQKESASVEQFPALVQQPITPEATPAMGLPGEESIEARSQQRIIPMLLVILISIACLLIITAPLYIKLKNARKKNKGSYHH